MLPTEIETERLLLRPYTFDDVDDVYAYAKDPEWGEYLPVPSPYKRQDAEYFVALHQLKDRNLKNQWAIQLNGTVVGGIDLNFVRDDHAIAEFHWSIGKEYWGQGIMTEAGLALRDLAFQSVPSLNRIQSHAAIGNIGSWRVMEKVGLSREGVLKQSWKARDGWFDMVWYALLRPEWEQLTGGAK
ncbi:MAG: GNAT family protein [Chloroflexota bacterium]